MQQTAWAQEAVADKRRDGVKRLPESGAWYAASTGQLAPCAPAAAFIGRFVDTEGGPQWIRTLSLYHSGFMQDFT